MRTYNPPKNNLLNTEVINELINAIVSGGLKPSERIIFAENLLLEYLSFSSNSG